MKMDDLPEEEEEKSPAKNNIVKREPLTKREPSDRKTRVKRDVDGDVDMNELENEEVDEEEALKKLQSVSRSERYARRAANGTAEHPSPAKENQ
jgi:hypothetical protein